MMKSILLVLSAALVVSLPLEAGPLREAQVTKIVRDVSVIDPVKGPHAAAIQETIKDDLGLKTGVKSRSELLFQDNTLTRIGPETSFSFQAGTRDLTLEQGTLLLQVPKGLGGAKIHTAAVTAAITGTTILIGYTPAKQIKVLVLEGSLRLSLNRTVGDSVLLTAGRMVTMRPDAKRIPEPVTVDLRQVMKTSSLVNMAEEGQMKLPSVGLIDKEIAKQNVERAAGRLTAANFVSTDFCPEQIFGKMDQRKLAPTTSSAPPSAPTISTRGR
jgi:hypothetical protein